MRIHFTGIAGAGMSAAALMMREAGHQVSGSDEDVFPPMSTYVEGLGFPFHRRFDAANLPDDLDMLVLGASAKLGGDANPEVAEARRPRRARHHLPGTGRRGDRRAARNTVVAGSFGKSTCTALMAHVLREAGRRRRLDDRRDLALAAGHRPLGRRAPQVVLEGDEYIVGPTDRRSKFVLYHPRDVLLTSLVHDHVNVFPTFADYEAPFRELLRLLPADGLLVAREHPAIRAIAGEAASRIVWYDTAPLRRLVGRGRGLRRDDPLHPGRARTAASSPLSTTPAGRAQHREHRRRQRLPAGARPGQRGRRWPAPSRASPASAAGSTG